MFESGLHGALGNFVKRHALNARRSLGLTLLRFLGSLLFLSTVFVEFEREMRGNGFALAVRVRREIDRVGRRGELLQPGDNFFFAGNDDVLGIEIVLDIDAERALGQIFHVPQRRFDRKSLTQIFLDGLRLGRRFDDD